MPTKEIERERGLYKNGSRWWLRVNKIPRSTGTSDLELANRIARMVRELAESPKTAHWLTEDVDLLTLYQQRAAGTLHLLTEQLKQRGASDADTDLDPWVTKWDKEHLAVLVGSNNISQEQRETYVRQVRALIPAGVRFPKSRFTEDVLKEALEHLTEPRSGKPLSSSTRRRYFVAWKLFYRYAKKRVPLDVNPFDEAEWIPANNSARAVYWDHETTLEVLGHMPEGEPKVMMTLILGSGMELGAALALEGRHVHKGDDHTVVAPGSKNEFREERTIFVDSWAWPAVRAHADNVKPRESLWTTIDKDGTCVREAFYRAQIAAGVAKEPPRSERTGKPLWKLAEPHTIHDARHTYCYVRLTGDDGEPRQSIKFCAQQLGHADEQMVMRIYAKANIDQKLRLLELREARKGRAA